MAQRNPQSPRDDYVPNYPRRFDPFTLVAYVNDVKYLRTGGARLILDVEQDQVDKVIALWHVGGFPIRLDISKWEPGANDPGPFARVEGDRDIHMDDNPDE